MDPADMIKAVGEIDDELIEESEIPRDRTLLRILPIAAALVLIAGVSAALILFFNKMGKRPEASAALTEPTETPAALITEEPFVSTVPALRTEEPALHSEPSPSLVPEFDYVRYTSAAEIAQRAEFVVRVRIVDSVCAYVPSRFRINGEGQLVPDEAAASTLKTIYGIQVLEVYKGGEAAEGLKRVLVPGGIVNGVVMEAGCPDFAHYEKGGECVMFLNLPKMSEAWAWSDMAEPVGFGEDRCDIEYNDGVGVIKCRFPEVTFDWLESLSEGAV